MKIKYSSSFWEAGKGLSGSPQKVNWQFDHRGNKCIIPCIYRFSKGIVFDIITLLDKEALRDYINKYEEIENILTPFQRLCAEEVHPYQDLSINDIWIDGKLGKDSWSSSSIVDIPWLDRNDIKAAALRKEYEAVIDGYESYGIQRYCIPYPKSDSKVLRTMQFFRLNRIKNIKFSTMPVKEFSPINISFQLSEQAREKEVEFEHPKTGTIHKLYFQNPEPTEISMGLRIESSIFAVNANYEIEPALPEGDSLKFENSVKKPEPKGGEFGPESISVIGIIGGASGPTAVCFGMKSNDEMKNLGDNGLPLHNCLSVPSFSKVDTWEFNIEGIQLHKIGVREYILGD